MDLSISRRAVLAALAATAAPLRASRGAEAAPRQLLLLVSGRKSEVSHWPAWSRQRGTIAFSHGAGSSPRFYTDLFDHWRAAGFEIFAPLHVDSREHADQASFPGFASWRARLEDMQLLSAHIGKPYVAAGHSYGGLVALTLGGAAPIPPEGMALPLSDKRARASIAFSPPAPMPALITEAGYASLAVPSFIQTGTRDTPPGPPGAPVDPDSWRGHLVPFTAAAPGGDRYALVLDEVDHYFGGAICRTDVPGPPQSQQLAQAGRLSAEFLRAYGASDDAARRSLNASLTETGLVRLSRR